MDNLGNIETKIFNNLREIEKNLILIQEKVVKIENGSKNNLIIIRKVDNSRETYDILSYNDTNSRETFDILSYNDTNSRETFDSSTNSRETFDSSTNSRETFDSATNSRETYDSATNSRIDSILESANNERIKKEKPKRRTKRNKKTIVFTNYVIDTSSDDE